MWDFKKNSKVWEIVEHSVSNSNKPILIELLWWCSASKLNTNSTNVSTVYIQLWVPNIYQKLRNSKTQPNYYQFTSLPSKPTQSHNLLTSSQSWNGNTNRSMPFWVGNSIQIKAKVLSTINLKEE